MGVEDTPPMEFPAHRAQGDHAAAGAVDAIWFHDWRRDVARRFDRIERDWKEALSSFSARLSGVEGSVAEMRHADNRHEQQVVELAAADAEHDRRISVVERQGGSGLLRRVVELEESERARHETEIKATAVTQAAEQSTARRLLTKALEGAADKAGTLLAIALVGLVLASLRGASLAAIVQPAAAPTAPPAAAAPAGQGHP